MYKIGTDPELFLKLGNSFVSAHGLFPGTKEAPHKLNKGAVQVDGLALEFNIDPASTENEFEDNIKTVLAQVTEMVKGVDKDFQMVFTPWVDFDPKYFKDQVPDEAKILGCSPDFNITGNLNEPPAIGDRPFRTAAGHIHIGWDDGLDISSVVHNEDCKFVATHFHNAWSGYGSYPGKTVTHEEQKRLKYYGYSGAYRPKPYGIELRHPSNLWLRDEVSRRGMYRFVQSQMNRLAEAA